MEFNDSSINTIVAGKDGGKDLLTIGLKQAYGSKPNFQRYMRQEYERGNAVEDTPKMVSEPLFGPASEEEATSRVEEAEKEYAQNQTAMTLEDFAEELKAEQLW